MSLFQTELILCIKRTLYILAFGCLVVTAGEVLPLILIIEAVVGSIPAPPVRGAVTCTADVEVLFVVLTVVVLDDAVVAVGAFVIENDE